MTFGTVAHVNAARSVFVVKCDDGTWGYFRVRPSDLPAVGDAIACDAGTSAGSVPKRIDIMAATVRCAIVLNAVLHLPEPAALALIA